MHSSILDGLLLAAILVHNGLLEVGLLVLASHALRLRLSSLLRSLLVEVVLDLVAVVGGLVRHIVVLLSHETFVSALEFLLSFFL